MESEFRTLLRESFKSEDTEEKIDVFFTRPIGLAMALVCAKLRVHPNTITVISLFIGIAAGCMFFFRDVWHNIAGVLLLMVANFCDSADGQLARLTNQKTLLGRILDGFSGDVWFTAIYAAIFLRLYPQTIPFTGVQWGFWALLLTAFAGIVCHSRQSSLADYYRQIHLYFLLGKKGSELDDSAAQERKLNELKEGYDNMERHSLSSVVRYLFFRTFYRNYASYCRSQEKRTPAFQAFYKAVSGLYGGAENIPPELRDEFRRGSLPLMKFANLLTFNARAILLYISCLIDMPYIYPLFEIVVFSIVYVYMNRRHEALCRRLSSNIGVKK